ncbi:MAG: COX15/CtaA family protein [Euryarchaeota archaeon]|nr:COX15/CtaA family protein [Euryarchaeota archaeon]
MRALRALSLASVLGAWVVISIGGFVTSTGSGLGCRDVILCGEAPLGSAAATIEVTHRVAAWIEGGLVLALLVLVLLRYRSWNPVRNLTVLVFVLIVVQSVLGMLSVAAGYGALGDLSAYPVFVGLHLAVGTATLAVAVLNAAFIFFRPPLAPAPTGTSARSTTVEV